MLLSTLFKKNTVTRESLSKAVKRETGIPANKAAVLVDQLIEMMIDAIKQDVAIKIRLLGTFTTKEKGERIGRNPKTMEEAVIAARKVVKFKVAPTLKKRINNTMASA